MDILRLPATLRRSIISHNALAIHIRRYIATESQAIHDDAPLPPTAVPDSEPSSLTLSPETLNTYTISTPPNPAQLKYAAAFFHSAPAEFLFSAAHFRAFPPSSFPEVAFIGRSNVGKSSLLNALFGRTKVKPAHVSTRPGRTRTTNGFGVSGGLEMGRAPESGAKEAAWRRFPRGGIVVVDMPGYGFGSTAAWGKEILKYLEQRKQLRRIFVLVDAEHGLKRSDKSLLTDLRRRGLSHQIVLSKVDKVIYPKTKPPGPQELHERLQRLRNQCEQMHQVLNDETGDQIIGTSDILCTSSEKSLDMFSRHRKIGIDELRWAIVSACGMHSDEQGQARRQRLDDIDILDEDG